MPSVSENLGAKALFFTGTDTGVGKTSVVCAVTRALRERRRAVAVCKAVATGAELTPRGCLAEDTRRLAEALEIDPFDSGITKWNFVEPLAPNVAARRAGVPLDLDEIADEIRKQSVAPGRDILLVEGVGGLLCPLTDERTVADLIVALSVPVVVVARRSLGTLNHTLLTLESALHRGLKVRGVVVSETEPPTSVAEQTNLDELTRLVRPMGVPILAVLTHRKDGAAGMSLNDVDWWNLAEPIHDRF